MPGTIVPLPVMLEEQDRKIYERLKPPSSMVVRYGFTRLVAELDYSGDEKPGCGSKLVVLTPRGTELAEMLTSTCPNAGCSKSVTRKEMLEYIENSGGKDFPFSEKGRVLRIATVDDLIQQTHFDEQKPQLLKYARQQVVELDLPMKIVEVEQLLGGERILFHYTSDQWVDFRELVKRLAGEYRTRIEMHQVNAREEARLVADYERCGQHCCCKQFLKVLKPVSMRSAKVQKATLDPTKISGRCGRLMCCLRYEDETYESLRKRLPHRQTRVRTDDGEGVVVDTQILTQLVLVRVESSGKQGAYPLENIEIMPKTSGKKADKAKPPRDQQKQPGDTQSPPTDKTESLEKNVAPTQTPPIEAPAQESSDKTASASDQNETAQPSESSTHEADRPRRRRRRRGGKRRQQRRGDSSPGSSPGPGSAPGPPGGGGGQSS